MAGHKSINELSKGKGEGSQDPSLKEVFEEMVKGQKSTMARLDEVLDRMVKFEGKLNEHDEKFKNIMARLEVVETQVVERSDGQVNVQASVKDMVSAIKEEMRKECQIRITGMEEGTDENLGSLRAAVVEIFKNKMAVEEASSMITDVFRVGKMDVSGKPRPVIARVGSSHQRNHILKGKKHLAQWKELGVDMDRTREQVLELKSELAKKKTIQQRGGRTIWKNGKIMEIIGVESHGNLATDLGNQPQERGASGKNQPEERKGASGNGTIPEKATGRGTQGRGASGNGTLPEKETGRGTQPEETSAQGDKEATRTQAEIGDEDFPPLPLNSPLQTPSPVPLTRSRRNNGGMGKSN
jgi:hypothetical protein